MQPTKEDIEYLLQSFDRSDWDEMDLRVGGLRLRVSSTPPAATATAATPMVAVAAPPTTAPTAARPAQGPAPASPAAAPIPEGLTIRAPNLGRFWRQSKPSEPPFAKEGQIIAPGDVVCLIEVMKLFTQLESTVAGRVIACPVEDGAMVEFDDVLFVLEPVES